MNVWYINHYAMPPDSGVPGRPYYLAGELLRTGMTPTMICAGFHHLRAVPAKPSEISRIRYLDGIGYYQLKTREYKGNGIGRTFNMLDFAKGLPGLKKKGATGENPSLIIYSSPHLFGYNAALSLSKHYRVPVIFEVRDIWPLGLINIGGVSPLNPLILWMGSIEQKAYKTAGAIVSLLPYANKHFESKNMETGRFHYIPNGINVDEWNSTSDDLPEVHHEVFSDLQKRDKLIVIYTGAHGWTNALDQILDLKKVNDNNAPYHFVLIGEGTEKSKLMDRARSEKITFISFLPKLSKKQVLTAIASSDACFIGWHENELYQYGISPNKIGDYFMGRKPVIHAVKAANDPVKEAQAGITVPPYSAVQLHEAILMLMEMSPQEREQLGRNGRQFAETNLDWRVLGAKYVDLIQELCDRQKMNVRKE